MPIRAKQIFPYIIVLVTTNIISILLTYYIIDNNIWSISSGFGQTNTHTTIAHNDITNDPVNSSSSTVINETIKPLVSIKGYAEFQLGTPLEEVISVEGYHWTEGDLNHSSEYKNVTNPEVLTVNLRNDELTFVGITKEYYVRLYWIDNNLQAIRLFMMGDISDLDIFGKYVSSLRKSLINKYGENQVIEDSVDYTSGLLVIRDENLNEVHVDWNYSDITITYLTSKFRSHVQSSAQQNQKESVSRL